MGCIVVYLPTYSPEFNPAQYVFNKLKKVIRQFEYRELSKDSLHVAFHEALKQVTPQDMKGFVNHSGYVWILEHFYTYIFSIKELTYNFFCAVEVSFILRLSRCFLFLKLDRLKGSFSLF